MAQRRAARYLRPPAGVPVSRSPTYRSLLVLGAGVLLGAALLLWEAGGGAQEKAVERGRQNAPSSLSSSLLKQLVSRVDEKRLWSSFLTPMLIERSPGSPGNRAVRELISNHLRSLSSRWVVDLDLFDSVTPRGTLPFGNVVATLDPSASRRLVLACHLDSKWFPVDKRGRPFVGATDSAVPCALILEVVTALDTLLGEHKKKVNFVF
ncbi:glutaminyl-peptide cyclotransferase-like protein [Bombina bombina]|uniref:glutaminyl-peptide cyclotransferase-like protein n=1 Tax=Bombina bombina TaxID=8345 RepID=UPI00235A5043|nr:glutaminyl-peptide cyclotransferase-like protein [Bombina bombina]